MSQPMAKITNRQLWYRVGCETPTAEYTNELAGTFRVTVELRKAKQVGQMDSKR